VTRRRRFEQLDLLSAPTLPAAPKAFARRQTGNLFLRDLRALTLYRPWPWAILNGKNCENRPWGPWQVVLGEYIALHAGQTWDSDGAEAIRNLLPAMPPSDKDHLAGAIVGVARVAGCKRMGGNGDFEHVSGDPKAIFSVEWFSGPFGWVLTDIAAIEPVVVPPKTGRHQGLWIPPADVTARVLAQIGRPQP
jgi:hypothetical protein